MRRALLFALLSSAALADNRVQDPGSPWPTTVDTPRATAMGGAHTAIATGNDALVVNPAGLSQVRRYHFEVDGLYDSKFPAQAILVSLHIAEEMFEEREQIAVRPRDLEGRVRAGHGQLDDALDAV